MGGADDAGLKVGKEDRPAIGGENAEREARNIGDHRVGFGPASVIDWRCDGYDGGAVDLMDGDEAGFREIEGGSHNAAVAAHGFKIVARTRAAVERGEQPGRKAALAGEETVADVGSVEGFCLDHD